MAAAHTAAFLAFAATAAVAGLAGTPAERPNAGRTLVLINANIVDGLGSPPIRNGALIVRDGKIDRVVAGRPAAFPGSRVIDLRGAWLLPGLIDAHVHFRDLDSARRALRSGVTSARSMGVDHFIDVRLARLHSAGAHDLPDVVAAGYHIRRRPSEALFDEAPELRTANATLAGAKAVRALARVNAGHGARVIKVMATERAGTPDTDFRRRQLSDEELRAAVDEASKAGLPVAAHAHSDDGARAAVLAGVRTVEHGTLISADTFRLMRRRNVCFVPTLSFWADMATPGGEYDHPALAERARGMRPVARRAVATAARMGVRIAAGSDMRYDSVSPFRLADEVAEMVRSGLDPRRAIVAATSGAAACVGISARTGAIRPGMEADLIAIRRNPLAHADALRDVRLVINNGSVALNQLGRD